MTGSYTIQNGDNLWKIVRNQYHLKTNREVANKVNELAKANHISNPNSIFAGKTIQLTEAAPQKTTTAEENPAKGKPAAAKPEENECEKFDKWATDTTAQNDKLVNDAVTEAGDFAAEHYKPEEKELRDKYTEETIAKLQQSKANLPTYSFIQKQPGQAKTQITAETYKSGLMKLANDTMKLEDSNKDGNITFDELKQKEMADLKKAYPEIDAETLKGLEEQVKTEFNNFDINKDGKVSVQERATAYAFLDQADSKDFTMDGTITQQGCAKGVEQLTNPQKDPHTKLETMFNFLFGKKD